MSVLGESRFGWRSNASFCCYSRSLAARLPGHVRLGLVSCQKCCGFFALQAGVAVGSYLMQSPDMLSFFNVENRIQNGKKTISEQLVYPVYLLLRFYLGVRSAYLMTTAGVKRLLIENQAGVGLIRSTIKRMLSCYFSVKGANKLRPHASGSIVVRTEQHPRLCPGWKILPKRIGY